MRWRCFYSLHLCRTMTFSVWVVEWGLFSHCVLLRILYASASAVSLWWISTIKADISMQYIYWWGIYSRMLEFLRAFVFYYNRVGSFYPSHHRTYHLCHTAFFRRVISSGAVIPADLLAGYTANSSAPLRGFGLAPHSIPRSRFRTFQYILPLLLYVLRIE